MTQPIIYTQKKQNKSESIKINQYLNLLTNTQRLKDASRNRIIEILKKL